MYRFLSIGVALLFAKKEQTFKLLVLRSFDPEDNTRFDEAVVEIIRQAQQMPVIIKNLSHDNQVQKVEIALATHFSASTGHWQPSVMITKERLLEVILDAEAPDESLWVLIGLDDAIERMLRHLKQPFKQFQRFLPLRLVAKGRKVTSFEAV